MAETFIRVEAVSASYRRRLRWRPVLDHVSFGVPRGTVTAVVGPNGAGKTSLFRALLGFLRPRSGRIRIGGLAPGEYRRRRGIGFLPESVSLPDGWTVLSFLERGAALAGLVGPARRAAVERARRRVDLDGEADQRLEVLSRGLARRVALAWILVGEPELVLLDEPLGGLDLRSRARVRGVLADLRRRGTTVLVASHEVDDVEPVIDRVLLLEGGRLERVVEAPGPGSLQALVLGGRDGT